MGIHATFALTDVIDNIDSAEGGSDTPSLGPWMSKPCRDSCSTTTTRLAVMARGPCLTICIRSTRRMDSDGTVHQYLEDGTEQTRQGGARGE